MAEETEPKTTISERTRIALTVSGAIAAVLVLIGAGRYWGSWEAEKNFALKTLAAHEARFADQDKRMQGFEERLARMETGIGTIQRQQEQTLATQDKQLAKSEMTNVLMNEIRVALAAKGINVRGGGG